MGRMSGAPAPAANAKRTRSPPRYYPLVITAAAACAGIVADRHAGLPLGVWLAAAVAAWIAWLALWRRGWDRAAGAVLLAAVAGWGGAWHHGRWSLFAEDDLGFYAREEQEPACVEAMALDTARRLPAPRPDPMRAIPAGDRTMLELAVLAVRDGADWQPASGRARLLVDGHLLGVHAGDRIRVFAQLAAPSPPQNPGEFDYAAHARADRRKSVLRAEFPDCVTAVAPAGWASWRRWLDAARGAGHRLLWEHVDPRRAGLASALLLGIREEVSAEETEAFLQTGTIHVLSISGLHVGLLAGVMMLVVRRVLVPRVPAAALVGATVVLYTLLAGAEPPAVRAMVLVLILCASYALGRQALGMNSLGAAALVVLALNPADLFRVGVQLSFLCVMGLIWFSSYGFPMDPMQRALDRLVAASRPWPSRVAMHARDWLLHLTLLGGVIWLLTLPLVMARFHLVSSVALVLNTLLWLPTLVVLCAGLGVLVFGGLVPPVAAAFGWSCDQTLALVQWAIEGAAGLPLSYFWVSGPADWWLAGFYGGLGIAVAFPRLRPPRRWCLALAAGWVALGLTPGLLRDLGQGHRARLDCTFLSVDHGCAVLVRFPSGGTLLYDAGSSPSPQFATRSIAAALWSRGIRHLDAVVLSHADADHYNGLPGLLERFSVGVIYVSPVMFDRHKPGLTALEEAVGRSGVPVRPIHGGSRLRVGEGCQVEVVHPPRQGGIGSDNANSLVLAIEYLGRRVLLPGDLDGPGLRAVMAEEPWPCDVLLAPHHGSRSSNPPGLAQWCRPRWVVVSGGRRFDVRQTLGAYRDIGSQVLHTAELGSIDVVMEATGVSVTTFRK